MTEEVVPEVQQQISIEQILAAILAKFGPVFVQPDLLSRNYSEYSVQVDQDPKTGMILFGLVSNEALSVQAPQDETNDVEPTSDEE